MNNACFIAVYFLSQQRCHDDTGHRPGQEGALSMAASLTCDVAGLFTYIPRHLGPSVLGKRMDCLSY